MIFKLVAGLIRAATYYIFYRLTGIEWTLVIIGFVSGVTTEHVGQMVEDLNKRLKS